jgi:DNA-3-methyladenine glycosylase II
LEEHALPFLKLSSGKLETMMAFIDYWRGPHPDFEALSDEDIRKELSGIKGIGKWTIDMVLLYTLNRLNVFPYDDFHLKQVMVSLYQLNPNSKLKAQMLEIASLWKDQQSLAVLYLLEWKRRSKA